MEKHIIYDLDFEELFYTKNQLESPQIIWGEYRSDSEKILVSCQIDKNDSLEEHISMVKKFLKDIDQYQEIAKMKLHAEYYAGETPIQLGMFIGAFYEKGEFGLQYTDFEEQGFKLLAFFDVNGEFTRTDLYL